MRFFRNLASSIKSAGQRTAETITEQETRYGPISFHCPSQTTRWRARTLLEKEPETIRWIDEFDPGKVFWDVGANIGVYSLYAAKRGMIVCAFEPSPGNFYTLTRNVELNELSQQISALCLAFDVKTRLDGFYQQSLEIGSALHQFGSSTDWQGNPLPTAVRQAMLGFSIDDYISIFQAPVPNYLKIDVDGIEDRIVQGAARTLADSRLQSLLIELDTGKQDAYRPTVDLIESCGLELRVKAHEPDQRQGDFKYVINHIFCRRIAQP